MSCFTDGIWELVQETAAKIKEGDPLTDTKEGDRKRTAGGVFLKLAKQRWVGGKLGWGGRVHRATVWRWVGGGNCS
jgi:hypothetical protein